MNLMQDSPRSIPFSAPWSEFATEIERPAPRALAQLEALRAPSSPARLRLFPRANNELLAPLREQVRVCTKCPHLAASRTQTVFGVGNADADLMFIGEAPGADEDARGEPFVGRAGQLLTRIIETMGFARGDVYIANVLKCRPDMPPGLLWESSADTGRKCRPVYPISLEQIEIIRPKVLGRAWARSRWKACSAFRGTMRELRGRWHSYEDTPLMITYHPLVFAAQSGSLGKTESLGRHVASARATWSDQSQKNNAVISL